MFSFVNIIIEALPEALGGIITASLLGLLAYLINNWRSNRPIKPSSILHNLPRPDYIEFIGRHNEFQKVIDGLTGRSYLISIDGIGGVGKSALALEVGHQLLLHKVISNGKKLEKEHYYNAIIWVSAKTSSLRKDGIITRVQEVQTLQDILNAILITLEKDRNLNKSLNEKRELVRRELAKQRVLLIIDNLETIDDEQLLEFLRELPEPTKAVITTRHQISETYSIHLPGLTKLDAFALARTEAKQQGEILDQEHLERLYTRTGGVPLAIVWSIAQMKERGVDAAITSLHIDDSSYIAEFCFLDVVDSIKKKQSYHTLLALSLFSDKANRNALSYVTGFPQSLCNNTLIELERLSLINKTSSRFWMLPLTKEFVITELNQPENTALQEKLKHQYADYYNHEKIKAVGKAKSTIQAIHFALDLEALFVWDDEISDYLRANYKAIDESVDITRIFYMSKSTSMKNNEIVPRVAQILKAQQNYGISVKILWKEKLDELNIPTPPDMIIFDKAEVHVHIGSGGWYTDFEIFHDDKTTKTWLENFYLLEKYSVIWK